MISRSVAKHLLLAALWGALRASDVSAQALHLTWNDCPQSGTASANKTFACHESLSESHLICSLSLAQPIDSILGVDVVVDLQTASATLPDWWRLEPGGCRGDQLFADDASDLDACATLWRNGTSGGIQTYTPQMPYGALNQSRIRLALGVPFDQAVEAQAGPTYYVARIIIRHGKTEGSPSCAGCATPVCLVLNSILVRRPPRPVGVPSADVFIETPGPGTANWAMWQGAGSATCQAVPVKSSSWGRLKSVYR